MKCHVCGSELRAVITDLPFKRTERTIVVIKDLPVLQCQNCTEYSLEDSVLAAVDEILEEVDEAVELEVIRYAA